MPMNKKRQQHDEAGNGSGTADIKQIAAGVDRRFDADKGAERAK